METTPTIARKDLPVLPDNIHRIPEVNLQPLTDKLAKLNKRAAKLNCSPVFMTVVRSYMVKDREVVLEMDGEPARNAQGNVIYRDVLHRYIDIQVGGAAPILAGWMFMATVQHEEGGNILRTIKTYTGSLPDRYRKAETNCEHCKVNRYRKDTYILWHEESNEWRQVGRSCLKDFLGHTSPEALANWAEVLADLWSHLAAGDGESFGGRGEEYYGLAGFLGKVATIIRLKGYYSKATIEKLIEKRDQAGTNEFIPQSTTSRASNLITRRSSMTKEEKEDLQEIIDNHCPADDEMAAKAIEWAATLPEDVNNDYLWNIRVIANSENITRRSVGLAVSIVGVYIRNNVLQKERAETRPSVYIGTKGKRETFTLTLERSSSHDTQYGMSTLFYFTDPQGNRVKWFSSSNPELENGKTYQIKATVKDHAEFRGVKETMITRASVEQEVEVKEPILLGPVAV